MTDKGMERIVSETVLADLVLELLQFDKKKKKRTSSIYFSYFSFSFYLLCVRELYLNTSVGGDLTFVK